MELKHLVPLNSFPEISHNSSGSRKIQSQQVTQNGDLKDRKQLPTPTDPVLICKACRQADQKENNFIFQYEDTTSAHRLLIQTEIRNALFFYLKTKKAFTLLEILNIYYLLQITPSTVRWAYHFLTGLPPLLQKNIQYKLLKTLKN